jgi:hypothetical protein
MKPKRSKIVSVEGDGDMMNGVWVYRIHLKCGHRQYYHATRHGKIPNTTICHQCSREPVGFSN